MDNLFCIKLSSLIWQRIRESNHFSLPSYSAGTSVELHIDNLFLKVILWTRCLFKLEPEGGGCVSFLLDVLSGILANIISRKILMISTKHNQKKAVIPKNTVSCNSRCFWVSRRLVSFLESSEQISRFGAAFKKPPPKRRFLVHQQGLEPGTR